MSAGVGAVAHAALDLSTGDAVVHFLHGTGQVVCEGEREHQGAWVRYVTVRYWRDDLTVSFPAANASELGLRRPIDSPEVQRLLETLTLEASRVDGHFVHRQRANEEALRSGDPFRVAVTIRDLHAREMRSRRLPPSEAELKRQAIRLLAGEIAAALDVSEDEARAQVTARLPAVVRRGRGRPRTRTAA